MADTENTSISSRYSLQNSIVGTISEKFGPIEIEVE